MMRRLRPKKPKGVKLNEGLVWTSALFFTYVIGLVLFDPLLKKLKKRGFVGKDMYKPGHPSVPELGGIGIALSYLVGFLFLSSIFELSILSYLISFVLIFYFIFGLIDDILGVGGASRFTHSTIVKMIVPLFFVYPLVNYVDDSLFIPTFGTINLGILYFIMILPLYVMVTANLVNMYSYYNGQSAGSTLIILAFLCIELYESGDLDSLIILFPFMGATLAFLSYNLQPAGVFPGDSGDMMMGAMIGIVAVLSNLEFFAFICLLPLTINFLMVAFWFLNERGKTRPKFGDVNEDGTIDPPNSNTLMWFFPDHFSMTERSTTLLMYLLVFISSFSARMIL